MSRTADELHEAPEASPPAKRLRSAASAVNSTGDDSGVDLDTDGDSPMRDSPDTDVADRSNSNNGTAVDSRDGIASDSEHGSESEAESVLAPASVRLFSALR